MFNLNDNKELDTALQKHKDICDLAKYFIKKETNTIAEVFKQKLKNVSAKRA